MASLLTRLGLLKQTCRYYPAIVSKSLPLAQSCFISTTKKKTDDEGGWPEMLEIPPPGKDNLYDKDENWISYGFDLVDREEDYFTKHMILFFGITLCMCFGGFVIAYMPDNKLKDWTQREAFILLAEREAKGLPPIDPSLIPTEKVLETLPTDEQLGDTEIIV